MAQGSHSRRGRRTVARRRPTHAGEGQARPTEDVRDATNQGRKGKGGDRHPRGRGRGGTPKDQRDGRRGKGRPRTGTGNTKNRKDGGQDEGRGRKGRGEGEEGKEPRPRNPKRHTPPHTHVGEAPTRRNPNDGARDRQRDTRPTKPNGTRSEQGTGRTTPRNARTSHIAERPRHTARRVPRAAPRVARGGAGGGRGARRVGARGARGGGGGGGGGIARRWSACYFPVWATTPRTTTTPPRHDR